MKKTEKNEIGYKLYKSLRKSRKEAQIAERGKKKVV